MRDNPPVRAELPAFDRRVIRAWERFCAWAFHGGASVDAPVRQDWPGKLLLAGCFLAGALHWVVFFNGGRLDYSAHDWPKEISYLRVIRESVQQLKLPFYINQPFQGTDHFLALPETVMSPQALLLGVLPPEQFVLLNILLLYSLGFVGLLALHRRFRFSPFALTAFFLLFNFNGYITSRMAVGHFMWSGYFLLPLLVDQVIGSCEDDRPGWGRPAASALVLSGILFQGSFHLWNWCVMFFVLLGIGSAGHRGYALRTVVIAALAGVVRLIPAALCLSERPNRFLSGYPTLTDLFLAFVQRHSHQDSLRGGFFGKLGLGWWEFDIFIGLAGLAFVLYYGVANKGPAGPALRFKVLDVPLVLLTFLSIADTYALFAFSPLPFAGAERVSARFIIVPFTFVLSLACARASATMSQLGAGVKSVILLLMVITAQELSQHSYHWRIVDIETQLREGVIRPEMPPASILHAVIVPGSDHTYEFILASSAVLSSLVLAACLWACLADGRWAARARSRPLTK